jgi:hypothetical protein
MFTEFPTYSRYRNLQLVTPMLRGEDVYALQTALKAAKCDPNGTDGFFGSDTSKAVKRFQITNRLLADGIVGSATWQKLAEVLTEEQRQEMGMPIRLPYGQVMHESTCRGGNYSPVRADGSYDAGMCQRNTNETPAKDGFNVETSIIALCVRVKKHYLKFEGVKPARRRWELAAGSWNAPAWACWLANVEGASIPRNERTEPTPAQRLVFEGYMKSATALMVL